MWGGGGGGGGEAVGWGWGGGGETLLSQGVNKSHPVGPGGGEGWG